MPRGPVGHSFPLPSSAKVLDVCWCPGDLRRASGAAAHEQYKPKNRLSCCREPTLELLSPSCSLLDAAFLEPEEQQDHALADC